MSSKRTVVMVATSLASALAQISSSYAATAPIEPIEITDACTPKESSRLNATIPEKWASEFKNHVPGKREMASDSFRLASQMRAAVKSPAGRALSEYWILRSLQDAGLVHLALRGFNKMLAEATPGKALDVRSAALQCVNQIHRDYPTLTFNLPALKTLLKFPASAWPRAARPALDDAYFSMIQGSLLERAAIGKAEDALLRLRGRVPYEDLGQGWIAIRDANAAAAAAAFERYQAHPNRPASLKPIDDSVHLILARTYYTLRLYGRAAIEFKKIDPQSNYFPRALSDRAWAYFEARKYDDSVGSSAGLMSRSMTRTFTPESNMVAAMNFMEVCHPGDAIRRIGLLKKAYYGAYKWLNDWQLGAAKAPADLYSLALAYAKQPSPAVPEKIAVEWLGSASFLANQKEINLLFDEADAIDAEVLKGKVPGNQGGAAWLKLIRSFKGESATLQASAVAGINRELAWVTTRMFNDLSAVVKNSQLIEAEAYSSLGDELLLSGSAQADGKTGVKTKKDSKSQEGSTWDWGRLPAEMNQNTEVWEDELGALRADLSNHCRK